MSGEEYVRRMQERQAAEAVNSDNALVEQIEAVLRRCHCPHGGCLQPHPEWKLVAAERIADDLKRMAVE